MIDVCWFNREWSRISFNMARNNEFGIHPMPACFTLERATPFALAGYGVAQQG